MGFRYSVSFEFDIRPVLTYTGTVEAGREHVGAARAIKEARKVCKPINWRSLVCVLERSAPDEAQGPSDAKE